MAQTNPWAAALLSGGLVFEIKFALFALMWIALYQVGNACYRNYHARVAEGKEPDPRSFLALVASRPTVLAGTVHSLVSGVIACGILMAYYTNSDNTEGIWMYEYSSSGDTINLLEIWRKIGLALSLSYFAADSWYYCLPRADGLIFVHHLIMMFCHYPVVHVAGATLAGAGDPDWVTWLSIVGYTSEISTALMNYRWYLINTLEEDWVGFGVTNVLTVAGWSGRVVMFTYLLVAEILPRYELYKEHQQLFTFGVMIFGHGGIGLLSLYWCYVMTRGGLKSLFVFKKKVREVLKKGQGFVFAAGVEGKESIKRKDSRTTLTESPFKAMKEEAEAYVDGILFNEDGSSTELHKKRL